MASLATQRIAAADSSQRGTFTIGRQTHVFRRCHTRIPRHCGACARIIHDRNLVPAVTYDVLRVLPLRIHRSLGVTVWMTAVLRLVWCKTNAKLPPFPDDMTQLHRTLVQVSEYCLYVLLVLQPTVGFGAMLTRGHSFTLFWGTRAAADTPLSYR